MVRISECNDWSWRNWVFFLANSLPGQALLAWQITTFERYWPIQIIQRSVRYQTRPRKNLSNGYCQYLNSNEKLREKNPQTPLFGCSVKNKPKNKKWSGYKNITINLGRTDSHACQIRNSFSHWKWKDINKIEAANKTVRVTLKF